MEDWTDILLDPRTIRAIFGDQSPSLLGVELHRIDVTRDGPMVGLTFNVRDFPLDPPPKWREAGFNCVQIRLRGIGVQELHVDGITTNPTVDVVLTRVGTLVRVQATGEGVSIDLTAGWVDVASDAVSAYLKRDG